MTLRLDINDPNHRKLLEDKGVNLKALIHQMRNKYVSKVEKALEGSEMPKKSPKYHNKRVEFEGEMFDSIFELKCWQILQLMEREGSIKNLKRQIKINFVHNEIKITGATPDFYFELEIENGRLVPVYADAKSPQTAKLRSFRIIQKLCSAFYGQEMIVFLNTKSLNIAAEIKNHIVNYFP